MCAPPPGPARGALSSVESLRVLSPCGLVGWVGLGWVFCWFGGGYSVWEGGGGGGGGLSKDHVHAEEPAGEVPGLVVPQRQVGEALVRRAEHRHGARNLDAARAAAAAAAVGLGAKTAIIHPA